MSLEVTGVITEFLNPESGTSKAGSEWSKQSFLVKTTEEYNNLYCFEVFGADKVENLSKYQSLGDAVKVIFNVNTNEWNGKYYTSLSAWRIEKIEAIESAATQNYTEAEIPPASDDVNEMPF